ncbi:lysophospholipase L1-like esterase [Microbacterium proteolyticum]|uniref:Lysophospholipase L1-like esterase n=1 Tax=Microbacterium proteolyticum TaxID=1572644 RepID=A0A7W5GG82_9MICO|nr:SGNH/GDSL hydrolase family protein [Microbacterium proteolyticum]MBB3158333.1 lysophospholipase L1-like esterase [Microbacterium proteolyticum]
MTTPTAVFIGDSITDAGRRTDPSGHYGAGYVRRIHEMVNTPVSQLTILNRGVGGDRAVDLEARWDRDVLAEKPDVLTVMVGINDMWRRYDAGAPTPASEFESTYDSLLVRALETGAPRIVLLEPFLVPFNDAQQAWHEEDLNEKIAAVHHVASKHHLDVIELDGLFRALATRGGVLRATEDGVHPAADGHQLIADQWVAWARRQNLIT